MVVRQFQDLVLGSLDIVIVSTKPDVVFRLDILIFPETLVLVIGEDRSNVPSLLFTLGLGIIQVKDELRAEVPDASLSSCCIHKLCRAMWIYGCLIRRELVHLKRHFRRFNNRNHLCKLKYIGPYKKLTC